jgi:hypothetical protein
MPTASSTAELVGFRRHDTDGLARRWRREAMTVVD